MRTKEVHNYGVGYGTVDAGDINMSPKSQLRFVASLDGVAILDIDHDRIVSLNTTGGHVWQQLRNGVGAVEIAQDLARDTGTDPIIIEHDVRIFVQQLHDEGLWSISTLR